MIDQRTVIEIAEQAGIFDPQRHVAKLHTFANLLRQKMKERTQQDYEHFMSYSGLQGNDLLRYAYFHGAGADCELPQQKQEAEPYTATKMIADREAYFERIAATSAAVAAFKKVVLGACSTDMLDPVVLSEVRKIIEAIPSDETALRELMFAAAWKAHTSCAGMHLRIVDMVGVQAIVDRVLEDL